MTSDLAQRFLAARRAVIASFFKGLNDRQLESVLTTQGPLLLLAGAGSGKTTVLIQRIANLVTFGCASDSNEIPPHITEDDVLFLETFLKSGVDSERAKALCALRPVAPWSILAITFTNKAANQLKDRLAAMLGPQAEEIWAMTFHSACCRILRKDIDRLGYDRRFVIYDTSDQQRVVKSVLSDLRLDDKSFPPRSVLSEISRAKDSMLSPEDYLANAQRANDFRKLKIASIYAEYQKKLKASNALDFDDLILLTVRLLDEHEDVRRYYQHHFRYVLIDEYQDTNPLQYQLAALLTDESENICVVGDDDQSIYKFRGATIENILNFENQYRNARVIRLEQNYRSCGRILEAANAVIAHNIGRKGKTLWTEKPSGEKVHIYEALNETDEAAFVADSIFRSVRSAKFSDFAVLYRTNAQSQPLEAAFQRNAIPYRIIGGHRFFDRAEVKDMLAYLYLIQNRSDDFHLQRIVNNPPRGIGAKTLEMAQRQADAAAIPLFSVLENARNYPCLDRSSVKLAAFCEMIEACDAALAELSLPEFYDYVLEETQYAAMLEDKNDDESMSRLENVRELKTSLTEYCERSDEPTLSGFLEEVSLFTDIEQYDAGADAVVMMTMHAAKGLEFPHVFLVGFEEGLFPGVQSYEPEELEEERRLCYVAITRAMQTLTISYAERRTLYGKTNYGRPSRFLMELPDGATDGKPKKQREFGTVVPPSKSSFVPQHSFPKTAATIQPTAKPKAPQMTLRQGETVIHKAFGKGMVLSVVPMGNDALLEIAFDGVGTKRLMLNAASQYLTKG